MPGSTDGVENAETQVSTQTDVQAPAASSTPESSEGAKPSSMLEAVKAALAGEEESPASDKPDAGPVATESKPATDPDPEDDAEGDDVDLTDAERAQLSEKTQRRMRHLADSKRELTSERDALRPRAEAYDKLANFLQQNRLATQDVDNTLHIAALIRNDPAKALAALTPIVEQLSKATGGVLPPDLQEQVRLGYTTRENALELARARANQTLAEQRRREDEAARAEERQATEHNARVTRAVEVANAWAQEVRAKDPDFELKHQRITERARLELLETRKVPDDPRPMLDRIKRDVDREFERLRPGRKAMEPVTGSASQGSRPKPQSYLDVVKQVVGQ